MPRSCTHSLAGNWMGRQVGGPPLAGWGGRQSPPGRASLDTPRSASTDHPTTATTRGNSHVAGSGASRASFDGQRSPLGRTSLDGGPRPSSSAMGTAAAGSAPPLAAVGSAGARGSGGALGRTGGSTWTLSLRRGKRALAPAGVDPVAEALATAHVAADAELELRAWVDDDEARVRTLPAAPATATAAVAAVGEPPVGAFLPLLGLASLRSLSLEQCHYVRFPNLRALERTLTTLRLSFNLAVTLDGLCERPLMQLEQLSATHGRLQRLFTTQPLAVQCPNLRVLDVRANALDDVMWAPAGLPPPPPPLLPPPLTHVCLAENALTALPADLLASLPALVCLDLRHNGLTTLATWTSVSARVRTLLLGHNRLRALPEGWAHLLSLGCLDLSYNRLTALPDDGFGACPALRILDVTGNALTALPEGLGQCVLLHTLWAGKNRLCALPASLARLHRRLARIGLAGNQLRTPDALAPLWALSACTELDLAANGLTSLPADVNQLKALAVLRIGGNRLTDLPSLAGLPRFMGHGADAAIAGSDAASSLSPWAQAARTVEAGRSRGGAEQEAVAPADGPAPPVHAALYANDNWLTHVPETLGVLTSLHTLCLDGNPLVAFPAELGSLPGLRVLFLSLAQSRSRLAPLPATLTVGDVRRLYLSDTVPHTRPLPQAGTGTQAAAAAAASVPPPALSLPMFLQDTDLPLTERAPVQLRRAAELWAAAPVQFACGIGLSQLSATVEDDHDANDADGADPWLARDEAMVATTLPAQGSRGPFDYVAVCSGWRGGAVARYCQETLHEAVATQLAAQPDFLIEADAVGAALRAAFYFTQERLRQRLGAGADADTDTGCAATVVLVSRTYVYTAHVGDVAAILVRRRPTPPQAGSGVAPAVGLASHEDRGEDDEDDWTAAYETVPLATAHVPSLRFEAARVAAGGGRTVHASSHGGVCLAVAPDGTATLPLARAFGCLRMGRAIACEPSLRSHRRAGDHSDLLVVVAGPGVTRVLPASTGTGADAGASMLAAAALASSWERSAPAALRAKHPPVASTGAVAAAHRVRGWAYALGSRAALSVAVLDLANHYGGGTGTSTANTATV
jgi:leucine-rich repeat protein SHOC2